MSALAVVHWTVSGSSQACDPDSVIWLTRAALSGRRDTTLHRGPGGCVALRRAGGRWQVVSEDRDHVVKIHEQTAEPTVDVWESPATRALRPGEELDLSDGMWWVGVFGARQWWTAAITVRGQGVRPVWVAAPADDAPTRSEATTIPARWPEPLPGARERVVEYLDSPRGVGRRLTLAYHYFDDLTGSIPARTRPEGEVAAAFGVALRRVSDIREQLQTKIWGSRTGHVEDLRRYLIDEEILRFADALTAQRYVASIAKDPRDGERLARTAKARKAARETQSRDVSINEMRGERAHGTRPQGPR